MRNVKWGLFLAASLLIGPSIASACTVFGTVVCEGTNTPVEGVVLTFTAIPGGDLRGPSSASDEAGDFVVPGLWGGDWFVWLGDNSIGSVNVIDWPDETDPTDTYTLPEPIEVPASLVPECGSQPGCVLTGVTEGDFTAPSSRPIGNPDAECDAVAPGSVSIGGGFNGTLGAPLATMDAAFAITKAGRNSYAVTVGVQEGDQLLLHSTAKFALSHVTYCSCPTDEASSSSSLSASTDNTAGGCSSGSAGALALLGLAAVLPRLRRRRT